MIFIFNSLIYEDRFLNIVIDISRVFPDLYIIYLVAFSFCSSISGFNQSFSRLLKLSRRRRHRRLPLWPLYPCLLTLLPSSTQRFYNLQAAGPN